MANLMPGLMSLAQSIGQPAQLSQGQQGLFQTLGNSLAPPAPMDLSSIEGIRAAAIEANRRGDTQQFQVLMQQAAEMMKEKGRNTRSTEQVTAQRDIAEMRDATDRWGIQVGADQKGLDRAQRTQLQVLDMAHERALQTEQLIQRREALEKELESADRLQKRKIESDIWNLRTKINAEQELLDKRLEGSMRETLVKAMAVGSSEASKLAATVPTQRGEDLFKDALMEMNKDKSLRELYGIDEGFFGKDNKKKMEGRIAEAYNIWRNGRGDLTIEQALSSVASSSEDPLGLR